MIPPHCAHCAAVQPLLVLEVAGGALLTLLTLLTGGTVVADEALVVDVLSVVDGPAGVVVVPGGVVPEHPTRDELTAMSSYQKVLVSPPYDSQPK